MTGLDIEFRRLSVYDVGSLGERFDVVLFLGVHSVSIVAPRGRDGMVASIGEPGW